PLALLTHRRREGSTRKFRLFMCACARAFVRAYPDHLAVVAGAEDAADSPDHRHAIRALKERHGHESTVLATYPRADAWQLTRGRDGPHDPAIVAPLIRCIFGNPFRPTLLKRAWQTPTATALAQAAYDERALPSGHLAPARLVVLADALEEAGCDSAEVLDHLRSAGPHVRGCWALDLILGRS